MNTRKWLVAISLIMVLSMVLAACAPAATPEAGTPEVVVETVEVVTTQEVVRTEVVVETVEVFVTPTPQPTTRTGAWVDQAIFTAVEDANAAVSQIQAGELDIYAYSVDDPELYQTVQGDANLAYTNNYGSFNEITYNPAVCTDTNVLNPFSNAKIREATNWLYDRNYVVQEISGGLGAPKFVPVPYGFPDYTRYLAKISSLEAKYAFNPEMAQEVITAEMEGMGATLGADGKWMFNDAPVTLIFLIRTEDERREIGDYVASQLESVGFTVDRQYKTSREASPLWVQSDPLECLWTLYTAGWINTEVERNSGPNFSFYYTNNDYPIPLFQAYQQSPEFDTVALALRNNDFSTLEEREELFNQALEMGLNDPGSGSVRVFINDSAAFGPQTADTITTADLAGGVSAGRLWPFTARFRDQEGGVIRIAQPQILVEPWNPVAGSNWVYDAMVQRGTQDYGTMPDPYTGLRWPQRIESAALVAKEGLLITDNLGWVDLSFQPEIQVPAEAWSDWNAVDQVFITAGERFPEGATANVKVSVCYPADLFDKIKWHDGSPMTLADFVYGMIMTFDTGKEDSPLFDEAAKSTLDAFMAHFKGVQITSTDPLCIDTYEDLYALDAENNVSDTSPFNSLWYPGLWAYGTGGWHNISLGALAEADGQLAFSADKAAARNVEWTSFIAGPSLEVLAEQLATATEENYIPFAPTMGEYVTADEASTRWANLGAFFAARNHFWVGNGPFMLYQVFPVEGTVTLQRFTDYPDPSNKWDRFGTAKIPVTEVDGPGQIAAGEEAVFDVFVTFQDQPYNADELTSVQYLVFDTAGNLVTQGEAEAVGDGQYQVVLGSDVTSGLASGSYKLQVAAISGQVTLPGFSTFEFIVP